MNKRYAINAAVICVVLLSVICTLLSCTPQNNEENQNGGTSKCFDITGDYRCDVCYTVISECKDADGDHTCDICKGGKLCLPR